MLLNTTKQKYNKGYKHFGKIGDVWKHLPLCDDPCVIYQYTLLEKRPN